MDPESPVRVFLVDDHLLFRIGIRTAFTNASVPIEVVGEAGSAADFFEILPKVRFDVVLLDIILPDLSGVEVARRLKKERPDLRILVLSAESDPDTVCSLVEIGVDGFISKSVPVDELRRAVDYVASGIEYFGRDISRIIRDVKTARSKRDSGFTDRENDIIDLCARGLSVKEMADRLGITIKTVETHKNNIFHKLGINSSVELVRYALKNGIISF